VVLWSGSSTSCGVRVLAQSRQGANNPNPKVRRRLVRKEFVRKELVRKELVRKELVRKELVKPAV